jgi:hypothetical protein
VGSRPAAARCHVRVVTGLVDLAGADDRRVHAVGGLVGSVKPTSRSPAVYSVKDGSSFDLWRPDTGDYYASAEPGHVLQDKRRRQHRHSRSAFSQLPGGVVSRPETLPCLRPRIAFRDVAPATDSRPMIAALVPPDVVPVHTAPHLLRTAGDERDEAFLLGVLSSIPLDWSARRQVELHVTFDLLNCLPIPNPWW